MHVKDIKARPTIAERRQAYHAKQERIGREFLDRLIACTGDPRPIYDEIEAWYTRSKWSR